MIEVDKKQYGIYGEANIPIQYWWKEENGGFTYTILGYPDGEKEDWSDRYLSTILKETQPISKTEFEKLIG